MNKRVALLIMGTVACLPTSAEAGVLTDDLSRCLVTKATDADKQAFMAWMFSAISADAQLQSYTTLDRAKRDRIGAAAASVFQRLLLVDCRKDAVIAIKSEGMDAIGTAFGALGQAATEQMFRSPGAQAELKSLDKNFDENLLKELGREAGIPEQKDRDEPTSRQAEK